MFMINDSNILWGWISPDRQFNQRHIQKDRIALAEHLENTRGMLRERGADLVSVGQTNRTLRGVVLDMKKERL